MSPAKGREMQLSFNLSTPTYHVENLNHVRKDARLSPVLQFIEGRVWKQGCAHFYPSLHVHVCHNGKSSMVGNYQTNGGIKPNQKSVTVSVTSLIIYRFLTCAAMM